MIGNIIDFVIYLAAALVLLGGFLGLYTLILPMKEWAWIRQGNVAASIVLGGALVGFSIPLAEAIRQTDSFSQMIVWAAIGLAVQLLGFGVIRAFRKDTVAAIERGDLAEAILLASASLALGLIDAACLS